MKTAPRYNSRAPRPKAQRGVVLMFALIALLILMIGAVALVRSFNTSLFNAGNVAFKKDLQNQSERAVDLAMTALRTGSLATPVLRSANLPASNYSAAMLPVNNQGIPLALLTDAAFTSVGSTANDIPVAGQQVTIRYVIDRLCLTAGLDTALGAGNCVQADSAIPLGSSQDNLKNAANSGTGQSAVPQPVVYRVSIRAIGPRRTQAYFQSTFSM
jgi:Tfp pilus assembly protein PilX